ncbi:MAG TPA: nucleotidyltransferase family protein [Caulobacteraceae bacterium]|jgi:MurNAc alpha-1-phosphate uridylyltransferase|nr:nucleotidyltransferase family protein [Caulobacteraceae bacterium]
MVLAAGLGVRMRPLTNDRPKALVEVGGKALIDHALDRLAAVGVETAVVNVHAFADLLEAHLAGRKTPRIVISDERAAPLETGGGLKKAAPLLGEGPVWVCNIDTIWIEHGASALAAVAEAFDPARMDVGMLVAPTHESVGFHNTADGANTGDLFLSPDGAVRFKDPGETAPFLYVGFHIARPGIVADGPDGAFGLLPIWKALTARGRVAGVASPGLWMHVGTPEGVIEAERILATQAAGGKAADG